MTIPIETVRAALLKIWPDGANCQHAHAREAFAALDAAQEKIAALPADWNTDSSLETWFPFTAKELVKLREERAEWSTAQYQEKLKADAAIAERNDINAKLDAEMATSAALRELAVGCFHLKGCAALSDAEEIKECDCQARYDSAIAERDRLLARVKELEATIAPMIVSKSDAITECDRLRRENAALKKDAHTVAIALVGDKATARAEAAEQSQRLTQKARDDDRYVLQQKCSDWGTYWRASDAHGVKLTTEQAVELLQDALGVEVEINTGVDAANKPAEAAERRIAQATSHEGVDRAWKIWVEHCENDRAYTHETMKAAITAALESGVVS